jgi:hypothetical protein
MKTFALLAALFALPLTAHATNPGPLRPFPKPQYQQVKEIAQQAGLMKAKSGQRLYITTVQKAKVGQTGELKAVVKGTGGWTGKEKNLVLGTATLKFLQTEEGREIEGGAFETIKF